MLALVKGRDAADAPEVADLPVPRPGTGEVLVKMGAAGLCYSDVMILTAAENSSLSRGRSSWDESSRNAQAMIAAAETSFGIESDTAAS